MDYMVGTIDYKRLRNDLNIQFRNAMHHGTAKDRLKYEMLQTANEQQVLALAKKEGFELRRYIR